ncbi:MAG: hypothetical protein RIB59_00965 [Rhodospirillales bacterium]
MRILKRNFFLIIASAAVLSACQTTAKEEIILSEVNALKLRSIQSRYFETPDQAKVFKSIISVMQDLGYALTSIEPEAGVISGNKLAQLRLTASIVPRGKQTTVVRANATVRLNPTIKTFYQVDSAEFYQKRFFEPLSQALFLEALNDEITTSKANTNEIGKDAKNSGKE